MKKLLNSKLFFFILGALVFGTASAVFAYDYVATNIGFTPLDTNWSASNVKDALDSLNTKIDFGGCKVSDIKLSSNRITYSCNSNDTSYRYTAYNNIGWPYYRLELIHDKNYIKVGTTIVFGALVKTSSQAGSIDFNDLLMSDINWKSLGNNYYYVSARTTATSNHFAIRYGFDYSTYYFIDIAQDSTDIRILSANIYYY